MDEGKVKSAGTDDQGDYNIDGTPKEIFQEYGTGSDERRYTFTYGTYGGYTRLSQVKAETKTGGTWASQVADKNIRWQPFSFKPVAFMGFDASLDVFNDGTVVLVPLFGHTPGSVGLFVTVDSGKRFFLLGDVVWSAKALQDASPKFLPASLIVDMNRSLTQQSIEQIRQLQRQHPEIVMVPAHDGLVHQAMGYFPAWAK